MQEAESVQKAKDGFKYSLVSVASFVGQYSFLTMLSRNAAIVWSGTKCASLRTNLFCCAQCAKMKAGCNQEQLHMYEKFQANWAEMGLKVLKDDFMTWYRPIVKKGSQFVKRIGDEDEERGAGKGKGRAEAEEEDEEEHSDGEPGEKQDENSGKEQPSPLKLRIPHKKGSTSKSSSKKPEDPVV